MGEGHQMDNWTSFAALWGPAVPMFGVFIFYLHRLIFRVIPRGFGSIRKTIERAESTAKENHMEAMAMLQALRKEFAEMKPCRRAMARKQQKE